jgi:predicted DNA-binding transcriptional regulator AlpA
MPPSTTNRPAPKGLLWLEDAAEKLGVEKSTLYKWRQKRRGPASFKHAGRIVYRETAIDDYLDACEAADSHSNAALNPLNRLPQPRVSSRRRPAAA